MNYGNRLKQLRNKKGLSQKELTERLNINRSTYARYETSATQPDYETLERLADFYEVSVDYILGRTDNPSNEQTFNPLKEIEKIANNFGIKDLSFYDIEEWKNFTKEDVEDIKKHFEYIAYRAKKRKQQED